MRATHGQIVGRVLYKRGKQVVKFFKYNGYAIPSLELQRIEGVKLYTKYDGNLYASRDTFDKHGIIHLFNSGKGVEQQVVLPLEFWEQTDGK